VILWSSAVAKILLYFGNALELAPNPVSLQIDHLSSY